MRHMLKLLSAFTLLSVTSAAMADQIDNPEYKDWAKFKAGTSITTKQGTDMKQDASAAPMPGMPAGMDMGAMMPQVSATTKLIDVKPDALTLEISTTTTQMGQSRDNKTTRTVAAKIDKPTTAPATAPVTQPMSVDMKNVKEGKETIDVGGKKIDTVTREYDSTMTQGARGAAGGMQADSHVKVWNSTDVPGGLVKMESTSKVQGMGDMKITVNLIDFTVAK